MKRTELLLQEIRKMRFEEAYEGWNQGRLTQAEAAQTLGMCERSFRRHPARAAPRGSKMRLQGARLVAKYEKRGAHRKRRQRSPLPGMMIHQDGSTHEWVVGQKSDLIVTTDDATSWHYSMFFVGQEGTASSFRGEHDVITAQGLFSSFYSDRGSHYWTPSEADGKVDKENLTQFGRAMKQLGIDMIAAYSPGARGRSQRAFGTHRRRLPQELALAG